MSEDRHSGFNCTTCGKEHKFNGYVAAHWNDVLTHTCDNCHAVHSVVRGQVTLVKEGKENNDD